MGKSDIVELLKGFVGKDCQDNLIFPILIATPNASNRGKTTSLKFLILALSNMNENNVKYVYGDPEFVSILNITNNTPAPGWLSNILQPLGDKQFDLSVVVTIYDGSGTEIKVGISTYGDEDWKIEQFLCTGTVRSILKPEFLECRVIFSACHGRGHSSYTKLEDICTSNGISICNIR